ncbi:MAG: hypothetical protein ACRDOY_05295 [Nocardioidaceae bacterium]
MSAVLHLATDPMLSGALAVNPEKVKPGWLGLTVVLILCVATYLLWRSMNRQLNKVRFDEAADEDAIDTNDGEASPQSAGSPDDEGPKV